MFETTSRLAENVATNVSRRRFLGSLGRWAGTAALALGGIMAFGGKAWAGCFDGIQCGKKNSILCCPFGTYCCYSKKVGNYCSRVPCP